MTAGLMNQIGFAAILEVFATLTTYLHMLSKNLQ